MCTSYSVEIYQLLLNAFRMCHRLGCKNDPMLNINPFSTNPLVSFLPIYRLHKIGKDSCSLGFFYLMLSQVRRQL